MEAAINLLVTVLAWWAGTFVDPLFVIFALMAGMLLKRIEFRLVFALVWGFTRIILLPFVYNEPLHPDALLFAGALALEMFLVSLFVAYVAHLLGWSHVPKRDDLWRPDPLVRTED